MSIPGESLRLLRELVEAVENTLTSDNYDPDDHLHWDHLRDTIQEVRSFLKEYDADGEDER
jgi:hypothetical protein